ncbi:glycosyltransferase, partial [Candidatus Magnetomorum sp. HK-1]
VKPDICINFFAIPCGPLALYMKKKYKVPYILCLRGGDVPGFSPQETNFYHKILKGINRTIWDESLEITANSKGLRNLAYKFHVNITETSI